AIGGCFDLRADKVRWSEPDRRKRQTSHTRKRKEEKNEGGKTRAGNRIAAQVMERCAAPSLKWWKPALSGCLLSWGSLPSSFHPSSCCPSWNLLSSAYPGRS